MIELLNIDCMEYMANQPNNSFDLTITSPPYNMNLRVRSSKKGYEKVRGCCSRQVVKEISTKYNNYSDNLPMDEYYNFINNTVSELTRISKTTFFNIQIVTGNKPAIFKMLGQHSEKIKELIIWDKCHGQPAIGERVLNSRYELIVVFDDNAITRQFDNAVFDRGTLDNLWTIKKERSADKSHGAIFPKELVNKVLSSFSKKGNRVFDPFLGTGTTAICSHYAGCDFVGTEIDEDYYNAACKRFDSETAQVAMF